MAYTTADIRNIVLLGHAGSGKTSLAEAMLHLTGSNSRLGSVDDGTSVSDADPDEKEKKHSLDSHILHGRHDGKEINIIDVPGMPDFINASIGASAAAEIGVVVISAPAGVEVNTRRMFNNAKAQGLARMIVVNKCDAENLDLAQLVANIQETFGRECRPVNSPDASGAAFKSVTDCIAAASGTGLFPVDKTHTQVIEAVVESDETLLEKYLGGERLNPEQLAAALDHAMLGGNVVPILFVSAKKEIGVAELLDFLVKFAPSPIDHPIHRVKKTDGTSVAIKADPHAPFVGQLFKIAHPQRGRMVYVRVLTGTLKADTMFHVGTEKHGHKAGHVFRSQGAETAEVHDVVAGDIATLFRLDNVHLHSVLHTDTDFIAADPPKYPIPMFSLAIEPKNRNDLDKVSIGLHEITEEDKTFTVTLDTQTGERVINGLGELHLRTSLHRLKRRRGLDVTTKVPKIPYRETIMGSAKLVEYTHKKQSGGSGQYGRVVIDLEPNERGKGYEFIDAIYGGSISQSYRPSVDKGVQMKMADGVLAGYPVVDVKVSLVDGKEHAVDSKDIAFQVAGREAFKKAFLAAKPVLLEPIVHIDVIVPADFQGTVNGQLSGRRGRILGAETLAGNMALIKGQMPLSEALTYGSQLQSATAGQGSYSIEFSHYDPVPAHVQAQLVAAFKPKEETD